jgi:alkyl hydroperoxide reductase subunit AhpC
MGREETRLFSHFVLLVGVLFVEIRLCCTRKPPDLQKYDSEVLGISVEEAWCHAAFARDRHLHFSVSSDLEPKVTVARQCRSYPRQKTASANQRSLSSTCKG